MRFLKSLSSFFCQSLFLAFLFSVAPVLGQESGILPTGITLPAKGSMYAINVKGAESTLVQLHAVEITSNSHAASNFARSMVYSGPRASIELKGLNADNHLRGLDVSFLARLSDDETDLMRDRLTLVRLSQTADRRVVSTYSQNIFGGQRARRYDVVPVTKIDVPNSNWVKLVPVKVLEPGEYGIIIMPKDPILIADAVYDFDIDFQEGKPTK